jgi:mannitol/fructose-specific phosphotransferase system IIA component (Ntr-type)
MKESLDFIEPSQIRIIPKGATKQDALEILIEAMVLNPLITDREAFHKAVFEREAIQSTGLGNGVAVPHVRIAEIISPTIGIGIAPDGVDYAALDNQPVQIIVLFATPIQAKEEYLGLLAKAMIALRNKNIFSALAACRSVDEVIALL